MPKKEPSPWLPGLTKSIHRLPSTKPHSASCTTSKAAAQPPRVRQPASTVAPMTAVRVAGISALLEEGGGAYSMGSGGCCWPRPCRRHTTLEG